MTTEYHKRALHRARIISGQMKALEKQIEDDAYCMYILTQSLAIQKSLSSLNKLVLENHLRTHIAEAMASGSDEAREKALVELTNLYELHNIRSK